MYVSFQTFSPCLYFTAFDVDITANTTTRNLTAMFVVVIIRSTVVYLLNYYENSVDAVKEKIIKVKTASTKTSICQTRTVYYHFTDIIDIKVVLMLSCVYVKCSLLKTFHWHRIFPSFSGLFLDKNIHTLCDGKL